ncbi:MAG: T9SS type A sorting domain-containing protein [Bacteroidetes bacterium]|nr:T9SS type A sorting domain-containing protein [Bacteroidota bacterium]MBU1579438.1 T9SS type A sorting domain-containing protein [Bacteroidota bacterium]MBU2558292.1 T9SS type A sorting domain-containing protein [Bacteroidota bacterium]
MKKIVLLSLILGMGFMATAQQAYKFKQPVREYQAIQKQKIGIEPTKASSVVSNTTIETPVVPPTKNTDIVSIIDIGTSANAYSYGYGGGQKSIIWTVPELNMVTNFHRMGGELDPGGYSGDLGYDVSFDGGLTWTNMIEMYVAENNAGGEYYTDAARYPNHGVYNPEGNTDVNNAWMAYHAANLDGSNSTDSWGGYSFGAVNMGDPSIKTKNLQSSESPVYQYIPDGFDLTKQGVVWVVDVNQDWSSGAVDYQGSIIVNRGEFDEADGDFVFDQFLLDAPVVEETTRPSHPQIAFSEDGQTGYISFLGDNETADIISDAPGMYPIIYKTTDGGNTWSEPTGIQLGGPNGLNGIVNEMFTDEQIAEFFEEPLPARDEIPYTTAFDQNIAVDENGNLHIAVVIGIASSETNYSISTGIAGIIAAYDLYTTDGGTTWHAIKLGSLNQFRGTWPGDYTEDNRIQITTSPDRSTMFVTWLDTDLEDQEDNTRPNIYARGIRPNAWGTADLTCFDGANAATNVTLFSEGMWNATFAAVSQVALYDGNKYTIPMTYQPVAPDVDPGVAVQYKYITDFGYTEADFCIVGTEDIAAASAIEVSQNFPNPFSNETNVRISLANGSDVTLEVYNITGQKVMSKAYGYKTAGSFTMQISADELPTGVYFYTVEAANSKVTRKMIVQ